MMFKYSEVIGLWISLMQENPKVWGVKEGSFMGRTPIPHLPLLHIVSGQLSPLLSKLVVDGKLTAAEALNRFEVGHRKEIIGGHL